MRDRRTFAGRGTRAVVGAALVAWACLAFAAPAMAAAPGRAPSTAVPLLRLAVTDGVGDAKTGDKLAYQVTISNRDSTDLALAVQVTVPAGLGAVRVIDGGTVTGATVRWLLALAAGGHATLRLGATVQDPPGTKVAPDGGRPAAQLSLTACAYVGGAARPVACASDIDAVAPTPGRSAWLPTALSALAVALAGAAVMTVRWWRATRRAAPAPQPQLVSVPSGVYPPPAAPAVVSDVWSARPIDTSPELPGTADEVPVASVGPAAVPTGGAPADAGETGDDEWAGPDDGDPVGSEVFEDVRVPEQLRREEPPVAPAAVALPVAGRVEAARVPAQPAPVEPADADPADHTGYEDFAEFQQLDEDDEGTGAPELAVFAGLGELPEPVGWDDQELTAFGLLGDVDEPVVEPVAQDGPEPSGPQDAAEVDAAEDAVPARGTPTR